MRTTRLLTGLVFIPILALVSPAALAQIPGASDITSTPQPGAHDYLGSPVETLNPANGSVSIRVPVRMPPGRQLTPAFSFAYDTNGAFYMGANPILGGGPQYLSIGNPISSRGGWSYSYPVMSFFGGTWTIPGSLDHLITCHGSTNYVFQDQNGNRHNLGLSVSPNVASPDGYDNCNEGLQGAGEFITGQEGPVIASTSIPSGNNGTFPGVYVTEGHGIGYYFPGGNPGTTGITTLATGFGDRNGNQLTITNSNGAITYTDTLGRTALSTSGMGGNPDTITIAGLGAPYQTYWTTTSASFTDNVINECSGAGCQSCPTTFSASASVVSSIVLPDSQQISLTYEHTYGMLTKLVYPSGGYVRYAWGLSPSAVQLNLSKSVNGSLYFWNCRYDYPAITDRYVSYDGSTEVLHQHFSYTTNWGPSAQWTTKQTTVTTYDLLRGTNFSTQYTYSSLSSEYVPNCQSCNVPQQVPVEQTIQYNDVGGRLLNTVTKSWGNVRILKSQQTTLDNNQSTLTAYCYDANEQITETDEYDLGTSTPSPAPCTSVPSGTQSGPLLRKTTKAYANLSPYHVVDLPSSVITYDGSGNRVAETDYAYDSPVGSGTSGIVQHSGTCNCGNLTQTSQWLNVGGSNPATNFTNDDTGQRLSMTDPRGYQTTYSFTDSYSSGTPPGPTNAYLTTITEPPVNGVSHIEKYAYAYAAGEATSHTDQNNQVTTYKYNDNFARLTETDYADGGVTTIAYNDAAYNPSTPSPSVTTTKKINATTNLVTVSAMDGLGQAVRSELTSDPSGTTYTDTTYDGTGHVWKQSNPYRTTGDSTYGITTNYFDALGRTCLVVPPDGTLPSGGACPATQPQDTVFTTYSGSTTTVTDEAGKSRKSVTDGLGRLTQVFEDPAGLNYETDYAYDPLGNLLCVGQKGTNSGTFTNCASIPSTWRPRTFTYDSLSRLLCASNPENSSAACPTTAIASYTTGTTGYAYDANGNLSAKTALAPNQTGTATVITCFGTWNGTSCDGAGYDALNRLTKKSYSDGTTPTVQFGYDAFALTGCATAPPTLTDSSPKPLRTAMCDGAGAESWSHDVMGRTLTDSRTTNGVTKSTVYTYLPYVDGSINTIAYPSGRTATYTTGAAERLLSVQDNSTSVYYANSALYAPQGALSSLTNGPDLYSTHIYNTRLQPCWLYTTTGTALATGTACTGTATTGNILDFKFNFNLGTSNNGNVAGVTNNRDTTRSQSYSYDSLNRTATAQTTSTYATSPANCWGEAYFFDNLTTAGGAWGNLTTISSPSTAYTGCTGESLSVTALSNNRLSGYGYDSPGNLNSGNGVSGISYNADNQLVTAAGVIYKYDGEGKRVYKSSGTLYWYGDNSNAVDETDLSGNLTNEYIFFNGLRIARRDPSNNAFYYFTDHLGTSRTIAEVPSGQSTATLCYDADFYPFGVERTSIVNTCSQNYKFTGKEHDPESGLDYFGARYDSSSMGRFMSADDTDPNDHVGGPQGLNLYSYVQNNPINSTDPDGRDCVFVVGNTAGLQRGDCSNAPSNATNVTYVPGTVDEKSAQYNRDTGTLTVNYTPYGSDQKAIAVIGEVNPTHPGPTEFEKFASQIGAGAGNVNAFIVQVGIQVAAGAAGRAIGAGVDALLAAIGARAAVDLTNVSAKIARQMVTRGWTKQLVVDTIAEANQSGSVYQVVNKATGGAATEYVAGSTGKFVVVDNTTKQILQVSGPGFLPNHLVP